MSVNILSTIMNNISPEMLARISSMLGIDRMVTEKTMNAAVPAVLAGIARMLGKPDGANQLNTALGSTQSGNLLEGLSSMVGGAGRQAVVSAGTGLLTSLLGSGGMKNMTDALSKFSGIEPAQANSLAGLAGLVTANGLNQVKKENGLDAGGLARMVSQQAPQFAAAMPSGFSNMLRGAADTFQSEPASTTYTAPVEDLRRSSGASTYQPAASSSASASGGNWMYWALGLLALLGLGWVMTSMQRNPEVATAPWTQNQAAGQIVAIGTPIYSADGERLGEVTEVLMGPNNVLDSVRLDVGAPLGIGSRIATMRADQIEKKGDRVVSKMTASEARSAPTTAPSTTPTQTK